MARPKTVAATTDQFIDNPVEVTSVFVPAFLPVEAPKAKTEGSRTLKVRRLPAGLYEVYYEGGGVLPDVLDGKWTSIEKAQTMIKSYIKDKQLPAHA